MQTFNLALRHTSLRTARSAQPPPSPGPCGRRHRRPRRIRAAAGSIHILAAAAAAAAAVLQSILGAASGIRVSAAGAGPGAGKVHQLPPQARVPALLQRVPHPLPAHPGPRRPQRRRRLRRPGDEALAEHPPAARLREAVRARERGAAAGDERRHEARAEERVAAGPAHVGGKGLVPGRRGGGRRVRLRRFALAGRGGPIVDERDEADMAGAPLPY